MKPKLTVTIGIPVYNEGSNIKKLLLSLTSQLATDFVIEKIIISSDGSSDNTISEITSLKNSIISIIENTDRQGIARGLNQIISHSKSDILVTLDADITIKSKHFVHSLVGPIVANHVDFTSSAIQAIDNTCQTSRILQTSMELKTVLFNNFKNGKNIYVCHGLARAYSKNFYSKLIFPVSIGNDMFSYLECISKGYTFTYTPNAIAWYKLPRNVADHKLQSERFFVSEKEMEKIFDPAFVKDELTIPLKIYIDGAIKSIPIMLSNPLRIFAYVFLQVYLHFKPKSVSANKQVWDIALSSK